MGQSYLTDATFDDVDAQRVTDSTTAALAQHTNPGAGVAYSATGGTIPIYSINIGPGTDIDVLTEAAAQGVDTANPVDLTINVIGNILHLTWGTTWSVGSTFTLINTATITGHGGRGGGGGYAGNIVGNDGQDGGAAIELQGHNVSINNAAGFIKGGGGGGGGGGAVNWDSVQVFAGNSSGSMSGSGAGGSPNTGLGGTTHTSAWSSSIVGDLITDAGNNITGPYCILDITAGSSSNGSSGNTAIPGTGGIPASIGAQYQPLTVVTDFAALQGGIGGAGGTYGQSGASGADADVSNILGDANNIFFNLILGIGGAGGAAGYAIDETGGMITWIAGNTPTRVVGTVG